MAAPNSPVQAILRVGRLCVLAVTDWVVVLTVYIFDGVTGNVTAVIVLRGCYLSVRVSAWLRLRARARKWARFWDPYSEVYIFIVSRSIPLYTLYPAISPISRRISLTARAETSMSSNECRVGTSGSRCPPHVAGADIHTQSADPGTVDMWV